MVARQPLALPLCQLPWSWCRWPWAASRKNGSQQRTRAGHSRRSRTSFEGFLVFWVMEALYQIRFHKFKQAVKQMPFSSFFIGFVWDVFLERFCSQPILAWFLTLVNCAAHHLPYFTWKQLHLKAAGKSESLNMGMILLLFLSRIPRGLINSHAFFIERSWHLSVTTTSRSVSCASFVLCHGCDMLTSVTVLTVWSPGASI